MTAYSNADIAAYLRQAVREQIIEKWATTRPGVYELTPIDERAAISTLYGAEIDEYVTILHKAGIRPPKPHKNQGLSGGTLS